MKNKTLNLSDIKEFLGVNNESINAKINVTPDQAKYILKKCNKMNRRIKKDYVRTLRRDMENGKWYSDIDYIGFDKDGILVNGQHRLKALSEANVKYVTLKFDFDTEQHISMDTGNARTYANTVSIAKKAGIALMPVKFKSIMTNALRLNGIKQNGEDKTYKLSNSELEDYWEKYSSDLMLCDSKQLFDLGKINSASVKASLFLAYLSGINLTILEHFSEVLRNGIAKSDYDIPIIRLRDELIDLRGKSSNAIELRRAQYTQYAIYAITELKTTSNRLPAVNRLQLYYDM